jgi:hypothetical protein
MAKANYILIEFEEKEKLISAFRLLKEKGFYVEDVLSPLPVEELDEEMPLRKSFIGWSGFVLGIAGLCAVLYFQLWVSGKAYPLNYGGKPFDAWLSFVPVLFESVVLLASLAMVTMFLFEVRFSSVKYSLPAKGKFTDDRFALVLSLAKDIPEKDLAFLLNNFNAQKFST